MKKIIIAFIIVGMAVSLIGCSGKTVAENILEKAIEKETGSDVNISQDGEEVQVSTSDGSWSAGGNLSWPKDKMGDLPELKGTITFVGEDNSSASATVTLSDVTKQDAEAYYQKITDLGYSGMNMSDSDGIYFMGQNSSGAGATFSYNITAKEAMVAFTSTDANGANDLNGVATEAQQTSESDEPLDMTDAAAWPTDAFLGLPEIEGKIDSLSNDGEEYQYAYLINVSLDDAKDYAKTIKDAGYTVDPSETIETGYYSYQALDQDGNEILYCYYIYDTICEVSIDLWKVVG